MHAKRNNKTNKHWSINLRDIIRDKSRNMIAAYELFLLSAEVFCVEEAQNTY